MPILKVYPNGLTLGSRPVKNNHARAKRGVVDGWSSVASRNNKRFLFSVDTGSLHGVGYAFTLTLRDCPCTSDEWRKLRNNYLREISEYKGLGFVRLHWVTEWQRRGVPHLHGIAYYVDDTDYDIAYRIDWLKRVWVGLTSWRYGSKLHAQHVTCVTNVSGWFGYLSKHAARGANHYQRSNANIPDGWLKTGRVWGHKGDWVTKDPIKIDLCHAGYCAYRRIVRSWRIADARSEQNPKVRASRIVSARRMLSCGDFGLSCVRGVSEWISKPMAELIVWHLVSLGYDVTQRLD